MRSYPLVAALLAAASHAINIPSTPTWPEGRCTDKSLTMPSWVLSQYQAKDGTTTFVVNNRAVDPDSLSARVTCAPGVQKCQQSAGGNEMRATLTVNSKGQPVIGISEFWYCADEGDRVLFMANGSTTVTSCSGNNCVSPITYLVQGTLSLPVPLTPAQPKPPAGIDASTCANVGDKQWTISGVEYKNYTKGQCRNWYMEDIVCIEGDFLSKGQYIKFNITNHAISHEIQCAFTPTYEKPKLPTPLRCTGGAFNQITLDATWTGTAPTFSLQIDELWYCLENPSTNNKPTTIVATGNTSLALTCASHTGITGAADDIVTICTDPSTTRTLAAVQTAKQTLPAFSLDTAYPAHGGCTFDSVVNPTWYYRSMLFETNADGTIKALRAGLTGPGFQDFFFYENVAISGAGADTVYNCNVYYDGKPREQHYKCTFSVNAKTRTIAQTKVWECRDKNKDTPLYFEGSGSFDWSLDPYYECSEPGPGRVRCFWTDELTALQPGLPFDVPKVTVSTVNVLPPDYGQPIIQSVQEAPVKTLRVNKEWKLAE